MRIGQPVTVTADIYGGDVVYHGHVVGLGAGSGSAFALLPPQNATGNWIKIVQRVPVRIALDPRELRAQPAAGRPVGERDGRYRRQLRARWLGRARDRGLYGHGDRRGRSRGRGADPPDHRGQPLMAAPRPLPRARRRSSPPLTGAALGAHRVRAGARHLHAGAGHHHRQRLAADHRRQSRRQHATSAPGSITAFAVANGIAVPLTGWLMGRYGVVRTFCRLGAAVHHRLVPVRHRLEPAVADRLPHAAGRGVRADDPGQPGAADLRSSPRDKRGDRAGHLVDDHAGGADLGPILGGYISDNYHWGWIFLINVPVGLFAALHLLAQPAASARRRRASCRSTRSGCACWWSGSARCRSMLDLGKNADWFTSTADRHRWRSSPRSASSPG